MRAHVTVLALQKGGAEPHEYEDAAWVGSRDASGRVALPPPGPTCRRARVDRVATLRAAVADGASDSFLARRWAEVLVRRAGAAPTGLLRSGPGFAELLGHAAARWPELMAQYERARERRGSPLAWFERPGFERGAHATLLVAHFASHRWAPACGTWTAAALGDSCLFQVRGDRMRASFPVADAADFDNTPALAASSGSDPDLVATRADLAQGTWFLGDRFYLATDAMAAWFLRRAHQGARPWSVLRELDSAGPRDFASWVERRRLSGEMRNDDVTLIRIEPR